MLASSRGVDFATVLDIQIVIALHCAPRARAYKKPDDWLVGDQSVPHLGERLYSVYFRSAQRAEDAKALAFASSAGVEDQFKEAADRLRGFESWREDQFKALPVSEQEGVLKLAAARRDSAAQFHAATRLKKLESANLDDLDEDEKERVLQDKDALREKASQFLVNKAKNEATMAVLTDREKTAKEKKNAYTRSAADYSRAQTQLAKLESLRTGGQWDNVPESKKKPMLDREAEWKAIVDTNVFGTLQVIKPLVAQMKRQEQGGSIVIINSMNSHNPWPRGLPYAASKAGLASATRTLATEYGRDQIRVNSLHCGAIVNEALWVSLENLAKANGTTKQEEYQRIADMGALGWLPTPEEYMGSVLYLLSDMSKPVTGISLHVNAGRFMN